MRSHYEHQRSLSIRAQAYEAGGFGRRMSNWIPTSSGPNSVTESSQTLRNRSRDAGRNNPWVSNSVRQWTADEIGTGIRIRSRAPDEGFRERIEELFLAWSEQADADGALNLDGMIALAVSSRQEAGEIFLRRRARRLGEGLAVPLQVQAIESEQCPQDYTIMTPGRPIKQGIEFDRRGQRVRYWMYTEHPGDHMMSGYRIAIPAEDIIHHYAPLRPGQIRGVPWTLQSLVKARDFDEYDDAELERKKTRAAYTGTLEVEYPADFESYAREQGWLYDPMSGERMNLDRDGVPVAQSQAGQFARLFPGEKLNLFQGDQTGSGYADFVRQQVMGIAAGRGIPYEVLSGDWGKVNDRLARVILNQYHRVIEQSQWHLTIPQVCVKLWAWFVDAAVLSGAVSAPGYAINRAEYLKAEYQPEGWPYIHPTQDVDAALKSIDGGLDSRSRWIAQRGWDAAEVDRQNADDQSRAAELGLNYGAEPSNPEPPDQDT